MRSRWNLLTWIVLTAACAWQSSALANETRPQSKIAEAPHKVLLIGDSFIVQSFGLAVQRGLEAAGSYEVVRHGKSATGLARPDFYDWWAVAGALVEKHQPQTVLLMMGGNDGQDLIGRNQPRVRWGTDAWPRAYGDRLISLLDSISAPGRQILMLELPPMRPKRFEKKVAFIRKVQREALAPYPSGDYLETRSLLVDRRGRLLTHFTGPTKRKLALREPDGVHFTTEGGYYFGHALAPAIHKWIQERPLAQTPAWSDEADTRSE